MSAYLLRQTHENKIKALAINLEARKAWDDIFKATKYMDTKFCLKNINFIGVCALNMESVFSFPETCQY